MHCSWLLMYVIVALCNTFQYYILEVHGEIFRSKTLLLVNNKKIVWPKIFVKFLNLFENFLTRLILIQNLDIIRKASS